MQCVGWFFTEGTVVWTEGSKGDGGGGVVQREKCQWGWWWAKGGAMAFARLCLVRVVHSHTPPTAEQTGNQRGRGGGGMAVAHLRLAGGVLVRVRDGAGEAVLRGRQDARLRVIVALPRQLADGRVAEPHVDVGHGVGALDALEVAGEHLVQQVGRLVEPARWQGRQCGMGGEHL
eukprot:122254-Chlamydomonas_euryale.AAC.2